MPKIGPLELVLILVIILLLFGATRLPQIGGSVGKAIKEFRKSVGGEASKTQKSRKKKA